ncbi:MAG: hypothetical protein ACR2H5_24765 [Ktedonobacteraceae bacterium]
MNGGIIVFLMFYIGVATLLAVGLVCTALAKPKRQSPRSRLGHTVWLCTTCHALYRHKVGQQCPQGHQVIEAEAWHPELRKENDDSYARPGRYTKTDVLPQ